MTATTTRYDVNARCKTAGCEGTPFFGESLSVGYCDSCHVDRMSAVDYVEKLDAIFEAEGMDSEAYFELRDDLLSFCDARPAAAEIAREAGYPAEEVAAR